MQTPDTSDSIDRVIVDAILAGHITAESRPGEQSLATAVQRFGPEVVGMLRAHIVRQRTAIAFDDRNARGVLPGDFHVDPVEAVGNRVRADILRDLTAAPS